MKLKLLVFCAAFFMIGTLSAQEYYKSAVGARLGSPISASYKTFISEKGAIEGYVGLRSYGFGSWFNVSGAYQVHNPISDVDGLQWYYGGGVSVFFWNYDNVFADSGFSSTSFGLQGYLGLDYAFDDIPLNLSLDWIPTFFIGDLNINSFGAGYGSLGVRYILSE